VQGEAPDTGSAMNIVWDERKRLANLDKHGLDFADVDFFDWAGAFITPSRSRRFKAIGAYRGRVVVVVYSRPGDEAVSIIGMRPASTKERKLHEEG
jgi:uncharacterized protein